MSNGWGWSLLIFLYGIRENETVACLNPTEHQRKQRYSKFIQKNVRYRIKKLKNDEKEQSMQKDLYLY